MKKKSKSAAQIWAKYQDTINFLLFVREKHPHIVRKITGMRSKQDLLLTQKRVERDEARKNALARKIEQVDDDLEDYLLPRYREDGATARIVKQYFEEHDVRVLEEWSKVQ